MKIDLNAPKGKLKAQAKTVLKKGNSMQPVRPTEPVPFPPPPPRPHEPKEMDKQSKITPYYLKEVPEPPPPPKPRFGEPPAPHIAPPPPPQAAEPPCVNPLSGPMMKPPGWTPPPPPSDKPVRTQKMIPMPFLPYATKDRLGAVKVGDGIEVDDKGKIYLSHDSVLDIVGTGDEENKGLVKLSDAIDDLESDVNSGTAATPKAVATVKAALDKFIEAAKEAFEALSAEDLNYWLNNTDVADIVAFLKALVTSGGGLSVDSDGKLSVDWDALLAKLSGDNIDNLREQMKVVWYRDDITTLYGHDRTFYFDSYTSDALTAEIRSEISDLANADFFGMQLSMWNGQEKWQFVYNTPTMYIRYLTNDSAVTAGGGNDQWSDWKSFNLKTDLMTKSEIEDLAKSVADEEIENSVGDGMTVTVPSNITEDSSGNLIVTADSGFKYVNGATLFLCYKFSVLGRTVSSSHTVFHRATGESTVAINVNGLGNKSLYFMGCNTNGSGSDPGVGADGSGFCVLCSYSTVANAFITDAPYAGSVSDSGGD